MVRVRDSGSSGCMCGHVFQGIIKLLGVAARREDLFRDGARLSTGNSRPQIGESVQAFNADKPRRRKGLRECFAEVWRRARGLATMTCKHHCLQSRRPVTLPTKTSPDVPGRSARSIVQCNILELAVIRLPNLAHTACLHPAFPH